MPLRSIAWQADALEVLDQTRLPHEVRVLRLRDWREVVEAIREMRVRGAPAIGAAGAYALALAARQAAADPDSFEVRLHQAAEEIRKARPTAVNLQGAVDRLMRCLDPRRDPWANAEALLREAHRILEEEAEANRRLSLLGAAQIRPGERILTLCNTGALATAGMGTALGILRAAHASGKGIHVYVCETRPVLQGARLTAWELLQEGIPFHLLPDAAAGWLMARGMVDRVIVGADRIAANGDVANKIGTYTLAVLSRHHGIPFWVAAPSSTVDLATPNGAAIPIESRDPREVTHLGGIPVAPEGTPVLNDAFDVTPAELVSAIVTDAGIATPPYEESLRRLVGAAQPLQV
ncbi:MAG: S-methyl-5-thioribose-1-phosphate isomerase [Armatimonadota bacterium]|nr:S-methyl-5-thioribose-1-phosphate isomerase [Armatimonadota bacterium]MDR7445328.1 S-methyl-5-thioribose-1-phosphate isomerase [Armatimonadota bacterium]MDR7569809.1 S-methyl-5-thioribose-1-phosphate isomerase [Armatimonadota bacterium]MDR7614062.1 S-methyl-5-thioribose-1-phosphate isomerase [Armatimonadota bacterium]